MVDTAWDNSPRWESAARLPESGSRELVFDSPEGWILYHVELLVIDEPLYLWLIEDQERALQVIDAVLRSHAVSTFDPSSGADLTGVEVELGSALAGAAGRESEGVDQIDLSIDSYSDASSMG